VRRESECVLKREMETKKREREGEERGERFKFWKKDFGNGHRKAL